MFREKVSTSVEIPFSAETKRVLQFAAEEADWLAAQLHRHRASVLGILREERSVAATILMEKGMRLNTVREDIVALLNEKTTLTRVKETPLLAEFSRDLTEAAMKNQLDPLVGRHIEIERVQQVLCRRTKNNAVLIGEPGVGKTAIVEGLGQKIAAIGGDRGRRHLRRRREPPLQRRGELHPRRGGRRPSRRREQRLLGERGRGDAFVFTGQPGTTTAGSPISITVTAEDGLGNTDATFADRHDLEEPRQHGPRRLSARRRTRRRRPRASSGSPLPRTSTSTSRAPTSSTPFRARSRARRDVRGERGRRHAARLHGPARRDDGRRRRHDHRDGRGLRSATPDTTFGGAVTITKDAAAQGTGALLAATSSKAASAGVVTFAGAENLRFDAGDYASGRTRARSTRRASSSR